MQSNKTNKNTIKEKVEKSGFIYLKYYKTNKSKRIIIQDKTGYKYDVLLVSVLRNQVKSFVNASNPFTLSHNIPLWLKLNNSQFELLEDNEYKSSQSKLKLYCKICKDYPSISWGNILKGRRCGICNGRQVGIYHNLEVQRPDIAREWHPTKNGDLNPKDVTYSSNKKVWWLCPNGHEYCSSVNNRTNGGNNCPFCSNNLTESFLATEIKTFILSNYKSISEYKIFKNPNTGRWLPFDVYIFGGKFPEVNGTYIEIQGSQHYVYSSLWYDNLEDFKYRLYLDKIKKKFAKKNGSYIEIDLRKIKKLEKAITHIKNLLKKV